MNLNSNFTLKGRYRIHSFKKGEYQKFLNGEAERPTPLRSSGWINNLVVLNSLRGLNIVIRRLAGDTAVDLTISSGAIGTGTNAPAITDTALQTPVLTGISVARLSNTDSVVTAEFFATDDQLADGTYNEFGVYVNSASEKLFARSLISPAHSKSAGEDTLIEYTITASST